jgi:dihydroneopterin aldolase
MDMVYIKALHCETRIGIHQWEREVRQSVYLDIEMQTDTFLAAKTDDIALALDYDAVSQRARELVESSEYMLVESLAEKVAQMILQDFSVTHIRLKVSKPGALTIADDVGVVIERGK